MIVSTDWVGFRPNARAEALRRWQWRSRSGVTPSKARAPSNTEEASQKACVRGPATRTLPSCQSPSSHVQVSDHFAIRAFLLMSGCAAAYSWRRSWRSTRGNRLNVVQHRKPPSADRYGSTASSTRSLIEEQFSSSHERRLNDVQSRPLY